MVRAFPLALAETTFWWIVGFLPICVFFEIRKEACAFRTGRDFLMRWLNGMEVELTCLNCVVVSVLLSCTGSVAVRMPDSRRVDESQEERYSGYTSLTLGWMKATILIIPCVRRFKCWDCLAKYSVNSSLCFNCGRKDDLQGTLHLWYFFSFERIFMYYFTSTSCLFCYSRWKLK